MIGLRAFKVELDLAVSQRRWCERACAASRLTYNWSLAEWKRWHRFDRNRERAKRLLARWGSSAADADAHLPGKPDRFGIDKRFRAGPKEKGSGRLAWLHELGNAYVDREAVAALGKAYEAFFRRVKKHAKGDHSECGKGRRGRCSLGAPRFHPRRHDEGFVCDEPKAIRTGMQDGVAWIEIPGLGRAWAKPGQRLPNARFDAKAMGRPCTCGRVPGTRGKHKPPCEARVGGWVGDPGVELCGVGIRRWGGRWYAAVRARSPVKGRATKPGKRLAVEVGVRYRAVTYDGIRVGAFGDTRTDRAILRLERRRKLWERRQSRRWRPGIKTRDQSRGWHEARAQVAKLHRQIAQVRADRIHHTSRAIVNAGAAELVVRDMRVKDLLQRGAASDPAVRNLLADDVQKASMSELRRQLEYKQRWAGGTTSVTGPETETKVCWACGAVRDDAPGYPWFVCPSCGYADDRDTNAAKVRHDQRTPSGDPMGFPGTRGGNGPEATPEAMVQGTGQPFALERSGEGGPDESGEKARLSSARTMGRHAL